MNVTPLLDLTPNLYDYVLSVSLRETPLMKRLREETGKHRMGVMQIPPDQGQFMAMLARLIRARRCLEIGTFTGYSALAVASVLPPDGKIICCDVDVETAAIAQRYWQEAGVASKIEFRLAPASETLGKLIAGGGAGTFDYIFIDADKENYDSYYESSLKLLRPEGLLLIDNTLWGGAVADPTIRVRNMGDTEALKKLNAKIAKDERVDVSLLYMGDGVTLVVKR